MKLLSTDLFCQYEAEKKRFYKKLGFVYTFAVTLHFLWIFMMWVTFCVDWISTGTVVDITNVEVTTRGKKVMWCVVAIYYVEVTRQDTASWWVDDCKGLDTPDWWPAIDQCLGRWWASVALVFAVCATLVREFSANRAQWICFEACVWEK